MVTGRRIVLDAHGAIRIDPFEVRAPGPNEVLVRTTLTQVSAGTEMNAVRARRDGTISPDDAGEIALGYTSVGIVEAVGANVSGFVPGDHVLGEGPHASHWLVTRDPERLEAGIAPDEELVAIPPGIDDASAAFAILGDVALHAIRHGRIALGESVAVHGLGSIGLIALRLARLSGAHPVIGVDVVEDRLRVARAFGASHVVNPRTDDVVSAIRAATPTPRRFRGPAAARLEPTSGADVQVHATSRIDPLPVMIAAAADRGRIVIAGATGHWPEAGPTIPVGLDEILRREITVVGSYQTGFLESHPYWPWTRVRHHAIVLDLIRRGELDVRPLVSHVVPHTEAARIYDLLMSGGEGWLSVSFTWDA